MKRKGRNESKPNFGVIIVTAVVVLVVMGVFVFVRKQREFNQQAVASLAARYATALEKARKEGTFGDQDHATYGEIGSLIQGSGVSVAGAVIALAILKDAGETAGRRDENLSAAQELRDLLAANPSVDATQVGAIVRKHPYLKQVLEQIKASPQEYTE